MGVRVIDACESSDEESCYSCCGSPSISANSKKASTASAAKSQEKYQNTKSETLADTGNNTIPVNFTNSTKDLIGNCKEFRIENNKSNLRIIGNGNRIRILNNLGNLNIIGNATRLKIIYNSGHIKYTGNDGRIYLGGESEQQLVDYIGCNGILKVINSLELLRNNTKDKNKGETSSKKCNCNSSSSASKEAECCGKKPKAKKAMKVKSASFGGSTQWQQFIAASGLHHISLPDLFASSECNGNDSCSAGGTNTSKAKKTKFCNVNNNVSIVHNVGNIVIRNSINISI